MRILLGNTEARTIFQNFELLNLNTNLPDRSHHLYTRYLQTEHFIPPAENNYFEHMADNNIPTEPSKTDGKGAFNIFALSLTTDEMNRSSSSSLGMIRKGGRGRNIIYNFIIIAGIVSSSPLKLEIEFEPVLESSWFLFFTFLYVNKIHFTGSKSKQEIIYDYLK